MKPSPFVIAFLLAGAACAFAAEPGPTGAHLVPPPAPARARVIQDYGKLPLSFEANQGQTSPDVKFVSRGNGYDLFLTPAEAVLALKEPGCTGRQSELLRAGDLRGSGGRSAGAARGCASALAVTAEKNQRAATVLRMKVIGGNASAPIAGEDELPGKSNYFIGNDPSKWRTNISSYSKVQYRDIYPGIDLVYYGNQRQLEHDFVVAPGANPSNIKLGFTGARRISLSRAGDLLMSTSEGEVKLKQPVIYQTIAGTKRPVDGKYRLRHGKQVSFEVASYDRTQALVIDPVLVYSTPFGGRANSYDYVGIVTGVAVDSSGSAYITGIASFGLPVANALYPSTDTGQNEVFVSKLTPDGSALVYSTYLGVTSTSDGRCLPFGFSPPNCPAVSWGIAADPEGNAYITGASTSPGFPAVNAFQPEYAGGYDAFVAKLNPTGSALVYSTYLGGGGDERAWAITADASGEAIITGDTDDSEFPVVNALRSENPRSDEMAFVTKFSADGSHLVYSTFLGGSHAGTSGAAVVTDREGNAYVAGATTCTDFPTVHAISPTLKGGEDGFITKLNPSGSALVYSTYLGGSSNDEVDAIALAPDGDLFIAGETTSDDFPAVNALYPNRAADTYVYITRLNAAGSAFVYSTYLPGPGFDFLPGPNAGADPARSVAIAVDGSDNAYVTGIIHQPGLPIVDPIRGPELSDGYVAEQNFLTELNAAGSALIYSTYLGGGGGSGDAGVSGNVIAVDRQGNAYVGGADTPAIPITGTPLAGYIAPNDGFIAKISNAPSRKVWITNQPDATSIGPGGDITYTIGVQNVGEATPALLTDILAPKTHLLSCQVSDGSVCEAGPDGQSVSASISNLAKDETITMTVHVSSSASFGDYNLITNKATVSSSSPVPETNSASAVTTVQETADLSIAISGSLNASQPGQVHYVMNLANAGPNDSHAVLMLDPLPTNATLVSASTTLGDCSYVPQGPNGSVRCRVGNMPNQGTAQIDVVAQVYSDGCSTVTNTPSVTTQSFDPNQNNNSSTVVTQLSGVTCPPRPEEIADLSISATASSLGIHAGQLHYFVNIANAGPNNSHSVLVTDPLPVGTAFVSASTTMGDCTYHPTLGAAGSVMCNLGNLIHEAAAQIDLVIQVYSDGCTTVTNTPMVTAKSIDPNPQNDSTTVVAQLSGVTCPPRPPALPYSIKRIGDPGISTAPTSVNIHGDVAGTTGQTSAEAFIYQDAPIKIINSHSSSFANSINDAGEVVGSEGATSFLYSRGQLQVLNLGSQFPGQGTATGINNLGQITGYATTSAGDTHAFLYQNGVTLDLGTINGATDSYALAINDKGEVTGYSGPPAHAFIYSQGVMADLGVLPGTKYSVGEAINSSGWVTGRSGEMPDDTGAYRSFLYSDGKMQDLKIFGNTEGLGINDCGEVVGNSTNDGAILYSHGSVTDLNSVTPRYLGLLLTYAVGINNRGQITGPGFDSNQVPTGFLITPVTPENCVPDLAITNTPDTTLVAPDGEITYTIQVKNLDSPATQALLTDQLNSTTTFFVSCSVTGGGAGSCQHSQDNQTVSVSLPDFSKGSTATMTVRVKAFGSFGDSPVTNSATVSSSPSDSISATAYTNVRH